MRNRGLVQNANPIDRGYHGVYVIQPCLYAASFVDLPGVVKIGRSWHGWRKRSTAYKKVHGGISSCVIYTLHDACPSLDNLEADVILHMGLPVHTGIEWFIGGGLRVAAVIEHVLDAYSIDYSAEVICVV